MQKVRTRFAPSPTGHLHIGNARTALMNYIFTRHYGGEFILRVEDTDAERSTEESETEILKDLKWLGLEWDEGPGKGGNTGPFRQSERLELYKSYADKLLESGDAYYCFCTGEELEARRKERIKKGEPAAYDGKCRNLTEEEQKNLRAEGRSPVIRFKVDESDISFYDEVKGDITFPNNQIGDFVIMRANGMPMYNFSCAVDDHLMKITHVIRGDDHVSNTPRQILVYKAFGWEIPKFAHIPMILGKDGSRLSKRHGATSVAQYREDGFLSETLVNFLSLLAWSPESGEEILSMNDLIKSFDLKRVSHSAAVFDTEKLKWMNGVHIRNMEAKKLAEIAFPFFRSMDYPVNSAEDIEQIVITLQDKAETIKEMAEKAGIFYQDKVVSVGQEEREIITSDFSVKVLKEFALQAEDLSEWNSGVFLDLMKRVSKSSGVKGKDLWMPVRIAFTGQNHGPELTRIVEIFGREKCIKFVENAVRTFSREE
ncbi:glutamate--tRNA ligase [bacterium]|nr:glutamate--tRNA ligase [bacterium]